MMCRSDRGPVRTGRDPTEPRPRPARCLLAFVLGAAVGCGPPAFDGSETLRLCDAEAEGRVSWYVASVPETVIDGDRTDPPLSAPFVFPALAPDGGLTLGSAFEAPVRTFSRSGEPRAMVGRAGGGPGEWSSTGNGGLTWLDDTLAVIESRPTRVHRFGIDGTWIDTQRIHLPGEPGLLLLRALEGHRFLGVLPPRATDGGQRLVIVDPDSGVVDSLALFQERYSYRVSWPDGSSAVGIRPISDEVLHAADPGGSVVVLVDRRVAVSRDSSTWRLRRIEAGGRVALDMEVCHHPVAIPEADLRDTVGRRVTMLADAAWPAGTPEAEQARIIARSMSLPAFWPPVDRVVVAADGSMFLRREVRQGALAVWEIRAPTGALDGAILLAAERWIVATEGGGPGDALWIERADERGVPIFERSRLEPAR
jgi:hypothetical protein